MVRGIPAYPRTPDMHARNREEPPFEDLVTKLGNLLDKLDRYFAAQKQREGVVWQVDVPGLLVPLNGGVGSLHDEIYLMAPPECMMSVRRLTVAGFTAGTVVGQINDIDPAISFANAGSQYFPQGAVRLDQGQHLNINATGITGQVQVFGTIDVFPQWYLPFYID